MSSSKFSSPFFKKSPLLGAYTEGRDAVFAPSDREYFKDLSDSITGGSLAAIGGASEKAKLEEEIASKNKLTPYTSQLVVDANDGNGGKITQEQYDADMKKGQELLEAQNRYDITYNNSNQRRTQCPKGYFKNVRNQCEEIP